MALIDFPKRCQQFFTGPKTDSKLYKISSGISLFGRPLHFAYSVGYIANAILFFLKNSVNWLRTTLPIVGLVAIGLEGIKEIFDLIQYRKTAKQITEITPYLQDNPTKFAEELKKRRSIHQLLGKKILREITQALQEKNFPLIMQRFKEQIKKAKIVHAICIFTITLTIASLVSFLVVAPFNLLLGVGIFASVTSILRHTLISGYLYQKGHKVSVSAMVPKWIRRKMHKAPQIQESLSKKNIGKLI